MSNKPQKDRRDGDDWLIKVLRITTIICWLGFTAFLIIFHYARPEMNTGLVRYHQIEIRHFWHQQLSLPALLMIWACALLSLITVVLNRSRSRRADDRKGYNMLLLLIISLFTATLLTSLIF